MMETSQFLLITLMKQVYFIELFIKFILYNMNIFCHIDTVTNFLKVKLFIFHLT